MSKKGLTLEEKALAQIEAESKAKLEQTMAKIAADEAKVIADAEDAKRKAEDAEELRLHNLMVKGHANANNALTQVQKSLAFELQLSLTEPTSRGLHQSPRYIQ